MARRSGLIATAGVLVGVAVTAAVATVLFFIRWDSESLHFAYSQPGVIALAALAGVPAGVATVLLALSRYPAAPEPPIQYANPITVAAEERARRGMLDDESAG